MEAAFVNCGAERPKEMHFPIRSLVEESHLESLLLCGGEEGFEFERCGEEVESARLFLKHWSRGRAGAVGR
jgi:hypothetical protein